MARHRMKKSQRRIVAALSKDLGDEVTAEEIYFFLADVPKEQINQSLQALEKRGVVRGSTTSVRRLEHNTVFWRLTAHGSLLARRGLAKA